MNATINTLRETADEIITNDRVGCLLDFVRDVCPYDNDFILNCIAQHNAVGCAQLMVDYPHDQPFEGAFFKAITLGHTEIVKIFTPLVDIQSDKSLALRFAVIYEYSDMVDYLYPLSNPQEAIEELEGEAKTRLQNWIDAHNAAEQHQRISQEVTASARTQPRKKM